MEDQNLAQDIVFDYKSKSVKDFPDYKVARKHTRWTQLDIARGLAIFLMILSHCVKGLVAHSLIPDWGNIPIHLITKVSSSLFILVFGFSLSMYFIPHVQKKSWAKKRFWMIKRGIELMLWYKLLTIVQMFQFYPKSMIVDTLLFKSMPDFVEILCFYSIALMWIPFVLPLWARVGFISKGIAVIGMVFVGQWLHYGFDFWGMDTLKAILVEHHNYYTFGQFQRGGIILFGLLLGDIYKNCKERKLSRFAFPKFCVTAGLGALFFFYFSNSNNIKLALSKVVSNVGKHPPELNFISFSLGGALLVLGLSLLANQSIRKLMTPISYLGRNSLNAFILHIVIIFYFYRYYFGLHHKVSYLQSLALTAACVGFTIILLFSWDKIKAAFK